MKRRDFTKALLGAPLALQSSAWAFQSKPQPSAEASVNSRPSLIFGDSITDVEGLKVGHYTLKERPTGSTVILAEDGAVGGVDVRGAAPGTRETDLLNPVNSVQKVQAVLLSGGSAYGLDAATGVVRYLEEHGLGQKVGAAGIVPIVPAAILFDLGVGNPKIRPNAEAGYQAASAATAGRVQQGNVGAGAGAIVGKLFGAKFAMKSGLGSASIRLKDSGIVVGAIVAVNAVGDIRDPQTGKILAGARKPGDSHEFRDSIAEILSGYGVVPPPDGTNTTIGLVASNLDFDKAQTTKIAQMAHDGLARSINPVHTLSDGDTIFALSTGKLKLKVNAGLIGAIAAEVMARAVVQAALHAESIPGFPAHRDFVATA
jgi:L-aminopeptidase/D-esterase-like protein